MLMLWHDGSEAMLRSAHSHTPAPPRAERPNGLAKRRLDRLRHIHPMTREQQMTLIEEARAARLAEQERRDRE
jgi:hypothetical protein